MATTTDEERAIAEATSALLEELFTHFELDSNLDRDPSLFLAYDRLAVLLGDDPDEGGVERAKRLIGEQ